MAKNESDREDLFEEAIQLVRKVEWMWPNRNVPVIAGFREQGWFSLYFGQDQMFQFNERGQLRRSYQSGRLYRTHGDFLAEMIRDRTSTSTFLNRRDLSTSELAEFQTQSLQLIGEWLRAENLGELCLIRTVPEASELLIQEIRDFCTRVFAAEPFLAPAIAIRR